ncbi:MAG: right-handed parallel beta-helix repeat-containing protein [Sulfuritalea sp.]|nr:right-handed parallel beta-helix repeat-containing protein [Sulfuritalea sp.]
MTLNAGRTVHIDALVGSHAEADSRAGGFGGVAGLGGALADARIGGKAETVLGGVGGTQGLDFLVEMTSNHLVTATPRASGGGLFGGQVNSGTATFDPTLTANLGGGGTINARDVAVRSLSNADTTATAVGIAVGALSSGASLATATMSPSINALTGAETVNASRNVILRAAHNHDGNVPTGGDTVATALSSSGALLFGNTGAVATANANGSTTARSGASSNLSAAGTVSVNADAANTANAASGGTALSVVVAAGLSKADANANGATTAEVGGSVGSSSAITARALGRNEADASANASGGGLAAGFNSGQATARANGAVNAGAGNDSVASSINSAGAITIDALSQADADAQAKSFTFGLLGGVGVMSATAELSPAVTNLVRGTTSLSGNGVTLRASHNQGGQNATATADTAAVGLGVTSAGANATATAAANTRTETGGNVSIDGNAGGTLIQALANNQVVSDGTAKSGSVAAVGLITATGNAGGSTVATSAADVAGNGLQILANAVQNAQVTSVAATGGILVSGSGARSTSNVSPTVGAAIGNGAVIDVTGGVTVRSEADATAHGQADGVAFSGGVGAGGSVADVDLNPTMSASIGENARITTHGGAGQVLVQIDLNNGDANALGATANTTAAAGGALLGASGSNSDAAVSLNLQNTTGKNVVFDTSGDVRFETLSGARAIANANSLSLGGVGVGAAISNATIGGTSNTTTGSINGTVGHNLVVSSDLRNRVDAQTDAASGGLFAGQSNTAAASATPVINAGIGGGGVIAADNDVVIRNLSAGDAQADAEGITVGLGAVGGSAATARVRPDMDTTVGAAADVTAGRNFSILASHNHNGGGADGNDAVANANASGGGAFSGVGANTLASASADMNTQLGGGGAQLRAVTGDFSAITRSGNRATTLASGLSVGIVGLGSVRGDALAGGVMTNAGTNSATPDNQATTVLAGTSVISGGDVLLQSISDQAAFSDTTAPSGGVISGASNDSSALVRRNLSASLNAGSNVNAAGAVKVSALGSGDADSEASAESYGFVAKGGSTSNARVDSGVTATAAGAVVAGGRVTVEARHSTAAGLNSVAETTAGALVGISGATANGVSATSATAQIGNGANIAADGGTEVLSATTDLANVTGDGQAYGAAAVGSVDTTANASSQSRATVGNATITGASLTVDAVGNGRAGATGKASSGGLLFAANGAAPVVTVTPQSAATVAGGANVNVGGNVTVRATGSVEGDGFAKGVSGAGGINVGRSNAQVTVTPTFTAEVQGGAQVHAGGNMTVEALLIGTPSAVSDGSFNPGDVDTGNNSINLGGAHGLYTGDTITYGKGATGNAEVGGLTSERSYQVIYVDDQQVKLGSAFAAADAEATKDVIGFTVEHGFVSGDKVIYRNAGNPSVSGLSDGTAYYVRVIDSKHIKLATSLSQATSVPKSFNSSIVDNGADQIDLALNGFSDGQAVTYRLAPAQYFGATALDDATDTFTVNAHGYSTGDRVTYRVDDIVHEDPEQAAQALTGLSANASYYVIRLGADTFKLAASADDATNGVAIAVASNAAADVSGHSLQYTGAAVLGGLVDGNTYYVINASFSSFQLAATAGGAAIDITGTNGRHTIGREGIEVAGAGSSGQHLLEIDLTGGATGTDHFLQGAGGARALVGSVAADNYSTASAVGSGGALLGSSIGSTGRSTLTSNINARIGDAAQVTVGNDLSIKADGALHGVATAGSSGGAFIAVGYSDTFVTTTNNVIATVGSNAQVSAGGNVNIDASSAQDARIDVNSSGGGFINSADVVGHAVLNHDTAVRFGAGASVSAGRNLDVEALSNFSGDISGRASSGGFGAGSDADMVWRVGSPTQFTTVGVGSNANLRAGDDINLSARVGQAYGRVFGRAYSSGLGANPDGHATAKVDSQTLIDIDSGAHLFGVDNVNLRSAHEGLNTVTRAEGVASAAGGDTDVDSFSEQYVLSRVVGDAGALAETHRLDVRAEVVSPYVDRGYLQDPAWIDDGDVNSSRVGQWNRAIDWNADALLTSGPNPLLVVNAAGNVMVAENVSYTNNPGRIIVNDIINDDPGTANFFVNGMTDRQGLPLLGTVIGTESTFTWRQTFDTVTLTNHSTKDMEINDIAPVNYTVNPKVTLTADNILGGAGEATPFHFDIRHTYGPTDIQIRNTHAAALPDLDFNGVVDNPLGPTLAFNDSGSINSMHGGAVIRSNNVTLDAGGNIGSNLQRLNLELVRSPGRDTQLNSVSGGDTWLGIRGLLRETGVSDFTLNLGNLTAGGRLDLLLREARQQTQIAATPGYEVEVQITSALAGADLGTTLWINHFRPNEAGGIVLDALIGVFGTGNLGIASTTSLGQLTAGTHMVVKADLPAQRMDLFGRDVWQGGSDVTVSTNGNVTLPSSVRAVSGNVDITSTEQSIYVDHVIAGTNVTLTARQGEIRDVVPAFGHTLLPLYTGNLVTAGGAITMLAGQDITLPRTVRAFTGLISLTSTSGNVYAQQVDADGNDVHILASKGSIFEYGSDADADVEAINQRLQAGGGIGASDNFLEIDSSNPSTGTLWAQAGDAIFIAETLGDLNLDSVTSTGSNVDLTVQSGDLVDWFADSLADVQGNALSFIASGALGSFFNDVEIDSRYSTEGAGLVNATAPTGVHLTEVVQALYVGSMLSSGGHVRLTSRDSQAGGEHIVVGQGRSLVAGGSVTLQAGDDLTLDGTVSAGERLFLHVDYHSADDTGGVATAGASVSGDRPELTGEEDDDTLDIGAQSAGWTVYGAGGADAITGGAGADDLYGGTGIDNIAGGAGDDLIVAGPGAGGTLRGGTGNDRIFGSDDGRDPVVGAGAGLGDTIYGDAGDDQIWALGGADKVDAGAGADFVDAGSGNDIVYGNTGSDRLYGGRGNDVIYGHGSTVDFDFVPYVADDNASDWLYGETGDDFLSGDGGDDRLEGGFGQDSLFGEAGNDELMQGFGQNGFISGGTGDDLLVGSDDGNDTLLGGAGEDRLQGLAGNDLLDGGEADDVLEAGVGDDQLEGGAGSDLMLGGAGNDLLLGHSVSADGDDNAVDWLYGDFGTNGNEPANGQDRLYGQGGNDLLFGEGGDDYIEASAGISVVEASGGSSNLVDYGSGINLAIFVGPLVPTPPVAAVPVDEINPRAVGSLPDGVLGAGRWADLNGSAADGAAVRGLSGDIGLSLEASVARGALGAVVAWSDSRAGNLEIYAARHDGVQWQMLAGSAEQGGLSATPNGASTLPSVAVDASGNPLAAWTETRADGSSDIRVARFAADVNTWVALGSSLDAGGVSATGHALAAKLVITDNGPVVVWTDDASGSVRIFAKIFINGAWVALGSQAAGTGTGLATGIDVRDLSVAASGAQVAVGYSAVQANSGVRQVYVTEYTPSANGATQGAWAGRAGSATGNGVSGNAAVAAVLEAVPGYHAQPSVAYAGNELFVAWQAFSDQGASVVTAKLGATLLTVTDRFASPTRPGLPQMASGGGVMQLAWVNTALTNEGTDLFTRVWNGSHFVEALTGEARAPGLSITGDQAQGLALAVSPEGGLTVAWQDAAPGNPEVLVRGHAAFGGQIYTTSGQSVQQLLDSIDLEAGDIIIVQGTQAGFTVGAQDSGVLIWGAPGSSISGAVTVQAGAEGVTLQRLTIVGALTLAGDSATVTESTVAGATALAGGNHANLNHNTFNGGMTVAAGVDSAHLRFNTIAQRSTIGLLINGGTALDIRDNTIVGNAAGLKLAGAASGRIAGNTVNATTTALDIAAAFTGRIEANHLQGAATGVAYGVGAELVGNFIHGNTVGVRTSIADVAQSLGYVGASAAEPNQIHGNGTGVVMTAAAMQNQIVRGNTTGVTGSGTLGGVSLARANLIEGNAIGVSAFTGTVQFNRLSANGTAVVATSEQRIWHNLFYRNTDVGVLVNGRNDVRVFNNTFYAPTGDNLRVLGGSTEVEAQNNLLWAMSGYNFNVANDSRFGFYSDYNNLYVSGTGKVGFWTKDFADIVDWQADLARFDLHSIGGTVGGVGIDQRWAEPRFESLLGNDFRLRDVLALQRFSAPGIDQGNALVDNGQPPAYANLLANAGFEGALAGWETNVGAAVRGATPVAYEGSGYFFAGSVEGGFARQTFTLAQLGITVAEADGQDTELLFGGRIRMLAESPIDRGEVQLIFRDGAGDVLATAVAQAGGTTNRWELVGQRADVPFGTRSVEFVYKTNRDGGGDANAYFDQAFLYKVSEAMAPDVGAYGHDTTDVAVAGTPRIDLRSPDLYMDWEKFKPINIRWETFGNTDDSPVRIDLYQDGPDGPQWRANIVAATPDSGQYKWIPGDSGADFGTYGLRVQVSLVTNLAVLDRSQEPFTVPEDGNDYWVDDRSNDADQYTPNGIGDNRNTGKRADAPKPNPVNLFRVYDLQAGAMLYVDNGSYPMIDPVALSGTISRGLGIDEGFTMTGPTDDGTSATLFPIVPNEKTWALIDLSDTDFVSIAHLRLIDANRGILVGGGSEVVDIDHIQASGHAQEGIYADSASPLQTWSNLDLRNNGNTGLYLQGSLGGLDTVTSVGNQGYGLYVYSGSLGALTNSSFTGNRSGGAYLYYAGANRVQGNLFQGNAGTGLTLYASGSSLVGSTDLSAGLGNRFIGNTGHGLSSSGSSLLVAGNVASGNTESGINVSSGDVQRNVSFGNKRGIEISSGTATDNRVYANTLEGLYASSSTVTGNTSYSNATGLYMQSGGTARSNLIYANSSQGALLQYSGPQFIGNTVYQTAGNAVTLQGSIDNARLIDNILWTLNGSAIVVAADSQDGFVSDFNIFQGAVGVWQGTQRNSLAAWRNAAFTDASSLYADPLFVDIDGADGVLGYASAAQDGRDDDFHLQSTHGSFHGGSLAPVLGADGLPALQAGVLTNDNADSPGIDRGALDQPFANEPAPNGNYVNIGADGNTPWASLSPATYIRVMNPNGGETLPQDDTFTVRWRSAGVTGNVALELSTDGSSWATLAGNETNDGVYSWTVSAAQFAGGSYTLRVSSVDAPAINDVSDAPFNIASSISIFYVNDGVLLGDEYTSAMGDDSNDGRTAATPKASLQALLNAYDMKPGDLVLVDTGSYTLTTNLAIAAQDSGVTIRGAVNHASVLNRANTNSGQYVVQLAGVTDVTLQHLVLTGGSYGLFVTDNGGGHRFVLEDSEVTGNTSYGIYVGNNVDDGRISGSVVHDNGNTGIYGYAPTRLQITGNHIYEQSIGIYLYSAGDEANDGALISGNRVHDTSTGIQVYYEGEVRNNEVWASSTGISAQSVLVQGNTVWANTTGIGGSSNTILDNTAYGNTTGISVSSSTVAGNRLYDNTTGLYDGGSSLVRNNALWDNSTAARLVGGYTGDDTQGFVNNTIVQTGGVAIRVDNSANKVRLRDNIIDLRDVVSTDALGNEVRSGATAITVAPDSEAGFSSDYNLFRLDTASVLANWENRAFGSRPDWLYETGNDQNSRVAAPQYVDQNGADDQSGWSSQVVGSAVVVDDGDAGVVFTGTWTTVSNATAGYGGDRREAGGNLYGTGANAVTYTFSGLTAGTYQVAATWNATSGFTGNAPYRIYDGAVDADNVVNVMETGHNSLPASFTADGANWRSLATVVVSGDTLTVRLSDASAYGKIAADAIRVQRIVGDAGADDDFRLVAGSAGVDGGDPTMAYHREPLNNGARIDQGAYGNTADATPSPAPLVQVMGPAGYAKLEVGTPVTVEWHTAGLLASEPVLLMNVGNAGPVAGGALGNWARNDYQSTYYSYTSFTNAVDLSGVVNPAPAAVYQTMNISSGTVGERMAWDVPVPDGEYVVRLHFAEQYLYMGVGTRRFDIQVNGELSGWQAAISGIEIQRAVAGGDAAATVDLEASLDNGVTWQTIATAQTMDRFGNGRFTWTPDQATADNSADPRHGAPRRRQHGSP